MQTYRFTFPLTHGLHARPASMLQEFADAYSSRFVFINERTEHRTDLMSIIGMVSSGTRNGDPCAITIVGEDEHTALTALRTFVEENLARYKDEAPVTRTPAEARPLPRLIRAGEPPHHRGYPAVPGFACARIRLLSALPSSIPRSWRGDAIDIDEERALLSTGLRKTEKKLKATLSSAANETEEAIIRAHLSILHDPEFRAKIDECLSGGAAPLDKAILDTERHFSALLEHMESEYVRERALDIRDVSYRLLNQIYGYSLGHENISLDRPSIIISRNISPSFLMSENRPFIEGIVLEDGGTTSHAVILARSFDIPCITGARNISSVIHDGEEAILDAMRGILLPSPDDLIRTFYEGENEKLQRIQTILHERATVEPQTTDGHRVNIHANISSAEEADRAFENHADGIGLFRSEMIFMDRDRPPSQDEQFAIYSRIADRALGKPVVIRTLDVAADKRISYLDDAQGPLYDKHPDIIADQLRAIQRTAQRGNVKVLFPMITAPEQVQRLKRIMADVSDNTASIPVGVMIETPSAARMIERLCGEVDFFSIGTNDLAQHFFNTERAAMGTQDLRTMLDPSFVGLINEIVAAAHRGGKQISLCGEIGSCAQWLPLLIGMDLDDISVSPNALPSIRHAASKHSRKGCRSLLSTVLGLDSATDVNTMLTEFHVPSGKSNIITANLVNLNSVATSREQAIKEIADILELGERITDCDEVEDVLWRREEQYPTSIGFSVAIPHCKSPAVTQTSIAFLRFPEPILWSPKDGMSVTMVIALAIDDKRYDKEHLAILAKLARKLMHGDFRRALSTTQTQDEAVSLIEQSFD